MPKKAVIGQRCRPGCATQGENYEELLANLYEAIEGCLAVDMSTITMGKTDRMLEIAV